MVYSDYLFFLVLVSKWKKLAIINAHAQTQDKLYEVEGGFYNHIHLLFKSFSASDK